MKRVIWTVGLLGLLVVGGVWFLEGSQEPSDKLVLSRDGSDDRDRILMSNPMLETSDEIKLDDLGKSLSCVDETGIMTCGTYEGLYALTYAVLGRDHSALKKLATREILETSGQEALYAAAAIGDLEALKILLAKGRELAFFEEVQDAFFTGSDNSTHPSLGAAEFGQDHILEFLVAEGLDVNSITLGDGSDLFSRALLGRREQTVQLLVDTGYKIDCNYQFPNGGTYVDLSKSLGTTNVDQVLQSSCR